MQSSKKCLILLVWNESLASNLKSHISVGIHGSSEVRSDALLGRSHCVNEICSEWDFYVMAQSNILVLLLWILQRDRTNGINSIYLCIYLSSIICTEKEILRNWLVQWWRPASLRSVGQANWLEIPEEAGILALSPKASGNQNSFLFWRPQFFS